MDGPSLVIGVLLALAGAVTLGWIRLEPETARRERRRNRDLARRARDAGLRGHFTFDPDRSKWAATEGHESYQAVDDEDRALFAVVGSRIEGESAFFAREMLWTDVRLAWVGVPLLLIGAVTCAVAALA